jgi:hypothetical protein
MFSPTMKVTRQNKILDDPPRKLTPLPHPCASKHMVNHPRESRKLSDRIIEAGKQVRTRLSYFEAPQHILAPFMTEVNQFVQTQLQLLDSRFAKATRSDDLLDYRRSRREVFCSALRLFAESFSSYRLFLSAISDELENYNSFLEEELSGSRLALSSLECDWKSRMRQLEEQNGQLSNDLESLKLQLNEANMATNEFKMHHAQAVAREKAAVPDVKRQLQCVEAALHASQAEVTSLREERQRLLRENESLFLNTFSDGLQQAKVQITSLKELLTQREDLVTTLTEDVDDLSRDLRKAVQILNDSRFEPVQPEELHLSNVGHSAVFGDSLFYVK